MQKTRLEFKMSTDTQFSLKFEIHFSENLQHLFIILFKVKHFDAL